MMGMGTFNSDDHYIYCCGQESLTRNGVALRVNKRVRNTVLGCNLKNNRMISVCFQGKPFNITVMPQALLGNAKPMPQPLMPKRSKRPSRSNIKKKEKKKAVLFIIGDRNAKVGSQEIPGVTGVQNEAKQRLTEFCQENALIIANALFQQHKR